MTGRARWRRLGPPLRATLRLAARSLRRSPASSALVALLVALPVAGLTGLAVFWESHRATPADATTLELGDAASWIAPHAWAEPGEQAIDEPFAMRWPGPVTAPPPPAANPPTRPPALVPADARTVTLEESAVLAETASGRGMIETTIGPAWDALLAGRFLRIAGEAPARDDEAMVSPGLLERLDARIGDDVTVIGEDGEPDRRYTITGTLRRADQRASEEHLFVPAAPGAPTNGLHWYVADWQPDYAQLHELNQAGYVAYARDLVTDPPPGAYLVSASQTEVWSALVVGTVAGVFSGYVVVLLATAALSVSARRQQRALAVAVGVGAGRGDVFRIVLLQGTTLGAVGAVAGLATGIGSAGAALALTDRGALGTFWGNWGLRIPWALLAAIALFALVVGTASAVAPARAATRGDPMGALRGARRPPRLRPRRPLWGVVLSVLGTVVAIAGASVLAATAMRHDGVLNDPLRVSALWALLLGPVLLQVGAILAGHGIFAGLARVLARFGIGVRIAARDAAASPSRVVPAFAAIGACVFVASFMLSYSALTTASNARQHMYWAAPQSIVAGVSGTGDDERAARELLASTSPQTIAAVAAPVEPAFDVDAGGLADPDATVVRIASQADPDCPDCATAPIRGRLAVVAPDALEAVVGVPLSDAERAAFVNGGALTTRGPFVHEGRVSVEEARAADDVAGNTDAAPLRTSELAAIPVDRQMNWAAIFSPQTATELGIPTTVTSLVAHYDTLPGQDELDRLTEQADQTRTGRLDGVTLLVERGPATADPWLIGIFAVAAVLVVAASALALGLSRFERRPDDATLAAVGGSRMLRRRINGWQALLVAGVGTVIGTVAGQIPAWGIAQTGLAPRAADLPWPWLAAVAVGLPVAIAAISWVVPPRRPDVTHRTVIA